jgi:hypothetical protein
MHVSQRLGVLRALREVRDRSTRRPGAAWVDDPGAPAALTLVWERPRIGWKR